MPAQRAQKELAMVNAKLKIDAAPKACGIFFVPRRNADHNSEFRIPNYFPALAARASLFLDKKKEQKKNLCQWTLRVTEMVHNFLLVKICKERCFLVRVLL